jgi:hypothetical protein
MSYDLTGPEALTAAQQVEVLSAVLGKPLSYVNVPDEAAQKGMLDAGMPKPMTDAMIDLIQTLRSPHRADLRGARAARARASDLPRVGRAERRRVPLRGGLTLSVESSRRMPGDRRKMTLTQGTTTS